MKRLDLKREVNLNKKFILILVLVCVLTIGLYTSYAYFQISVIQNNVVVLQTASINITTVISGYDTPSFTLNQGESKTITINLSSTADGDIAYKMYYIMTSGEATFDVTSTTSFTNDIVEGEMNKTETIVFTFENTGDSTITITLGTQGGLKDYPITLEQGTELVLDGGVESSNDFKELVISNNTSSCPTYVEEDGITYISGSKDCIDFNYVWYSGKLWRITAIYPDGTMKMITDDTVTAIKYGSDVNFYTDESNSSYIYQWLNEDFLDTLYNYENIIVTDASWNAIQTSSTSTKPTETTMITAPVGLLNSYEYYKSYENTDSYHGYLNNGYFWWLLNSYSSSYVWDVDNIGRADNSPPSNFASGARPSINLQSGITINGGTGTSDDPYTISGDKETITAGTTLLNTRQSGEYVNFDGELYRIVGIENNTTKLNKMEYVIDSDNTVIIKNFSSSISYVTYGGTGTTDETYWAGYLNNTDETYWAGYLNNTWYNSISETYKNMLVEGTYYLGTTSSNYKSAICATASNTVTTADCEKTSNTWIGYVGLPRYGEMFASQQGSGYSSSEHMWLITPYSSSSVWYVYFSGYLMSKLPSGDTFGARPSINLSSAVKITGGTGLKNDPFEISL